MKTDLDANLMTTKELLMVIKASLPNHVGEVHLIAVDGQDMLRSMLSDTYRMRVGLICNGEWEVLYSVVGQSREECVQRLAAAATCTWKKINITFP